MKVIQQRSEVEDFQVLVPRGGLKHSVNPSVSEEDVGSLNTIFTNKITNPSSLLGGIPVEVVIAEEYESSDEDEVRHETDMEAMERITVSRATKATFSENKCAREELIAIRRKVMELQGYLERNGLSMASFEWDTMMKEKDLNMGFQAKLQQGLSRGEMSLGFTLLWTS